MFTRPFQLGRLGLLSFAAACASFSPAARAAEALAAGAGPDDSLWSLFQRGGWCMWPILFCAVVGLAFFLERMLELRYSQHLPRDFDKELVHVVDARGVDAGLALCLEKQSSLSRILYAALLRYGTTRGDMEAAMLGECQRLRHDLRKNCRWLAFFCYIAPLTGLLGACWNLALSLEQARATPDDLGALFGGGATALIPLTFGLLAAIPLLLACHIASGRAEDMVRDIAEQGADALVTLDRKARRSMRLIDDIEENLDTQEMRAAPVPANLDAEFEESERDKMIKTSVTTPAHALPALNSDSAGTRRASTHGEIKAAASGIGDKAKTTRRASTPPPKREG